MGANVDISGRRATLLVSTLVELCKRVFLGTTVNIEAHMFGTQGLCSRKLALSEKKWGVFFGCLGGSEKTHQFLYRLELTPPPRMAGSSSGSAKPQHV